MATAAQQAAFVNQWSGAAAQAGAALGDSPNVILAQWALESGYGTNSGASINNVGGIMVPGSNVQQSFASPADFVNGYVNTIISNFPGAENQGSNASGFVSGLNNNGMSYYGNDPNYATNVASIANTLGSSTGVSGGANGTATAGTNASATTSGGSPATATTTAGASPVASCSGGVFNWSCWSAVAGDAAFVVLGVMVLIVAVAAGVFGEGARKQLVMVTKR